MDRQQVPIGAPCISCMRAGGPLPAMQIDPPLPSLSPSSLRFIALLPLLSRCWCAAVLSQQGDGERCNFVRSVDPEKAIGQLQAEQIGSSSHAASAAASVMKRSLVSLPPWCVAAGCSQPCGTGICINHRRCEVHTIALMVKRQK